MKFPILIQQEGSSGYCVHSPDVPGCFAVGDSLDEAVSGFRELLEHHIRESREAGREPPRPTTLVDTIEVVDVA